MSHDKVWLTKDELAGGRYGDWCPDRRCEPNPVRYPFRLEASGDAYYYCHCCGATWRCWWALDRPNTRSALGAHRPIDIPAIPRNPAARLTWLGALDKVIADDVFESGNRLAAEGHDAKAVRDVISGFDEYLTSRIRNAVAAAVELWANS